MAITLASVRSPKRADVLTQFWQPLNKYDSGEQGLSEPVGAMLALFVVRPFLSEALLHFILAFVGGIMVTRAISLNTKVLQRKHI